MTQLRENAQSDIGDRAMSAYGRVENAMWTNVALAKLRVAVRPPRRAAE